jgi:D-alanyl-D-alanine carboxypeptidase
MRFWLSYFATVTLLTCLALVLLWTTTPFFSEKQEVLSPIPQFANLTSNNQVRLLDLWKPFVEKIYGDSGDLPLVTAKSALMYDLTTNKVLYERSSKTQLPMASLTKIMTAVVALEHPKSDDSYKVYPENIVGEDSMGIQPGETFTLEELLYGLVLKSGNDAAEVLASNYPLGRDAFVSAMNEKAKALGLTDTQFSNPSGLQGDGEQHTTAQDLLVITRYALDQFPLFQKVAASAEHILPATTGHGEYVLENETNLLTTYPGVRGVKTGYTPEAGLCLVTYLEYDDHKIIGILLNSENRRQEMKDLLDYSLKRLSITPPAHQ